MKTKGIMFTTGLLMFLALSALVFSQKRVLFSHKKHREVDCQMCHANVSESTRASDQNLPERSKTCTMCHQEAGFVEQVAVNAPSIKMKLEFNHKKHIGDFGLECNGCHSVTGQGGMEYPPMETCRQCHSEDAAPAQCNFCHKEKVQFPHKTHNAMNLECTFCHEKIEKSASTTFGGDIPAASLCRGCHENEIPAAVALDRYTQKIEFNHAFHIQNFGFTCDACHEAAYRQNNFAQKEIVPSMEFCSGCHDGSTAPATCNLCHVKAVPRPLNHDFNWMKVHKSRAAESKESCMSCHVTENFCLGCHEGSSKPLITHNPNYELTHKFESLVSMKNCSGCHSNRDCMNCHLRKGVTQQNDPVLFSPHPKGWLLKGSSENHARRAKMRLSQCTTCHIKADCDFCHIQK